MASRFPSQLDDIDVLPTVRDNLTSINGELFNRLRDSILSVQRALGIEIQGNFSDLASRLGVIINPDGSLNKQALIATGMIYGPITNDDVSPNAKIAESKLFLNYPTALLQDSIRILDARNAGLIDLILSANANIQQHITRAIGAHRATAIATDVQATAVQSSVASLKIEQSNVQLVLQDLYAGHINFYSGVNSDQLTLTNSPHQANQIFYDNRNTELATNSVQGAIDNLYDKGNSFISEHQRQLHSNGIQRRVEQVDTSNSSGISRGRIIISDFDARLFYPNSGSDTSLFLDIPIQLGSTTPGIPLVALNPDGAMETVLIDVDDSLQITDPFGNQYALLPISDLKISPFTDPATNLTTNYLLGLDVFYNSNIFTQLFTANSITSSNPQLKITASVYKKVDVQSNENGLNCIARVLKPNSVSEPNLSSSVSEIQVAHPNAATIISKGFNPSALGRRADGYFDRNFSSVLTLVVDKDNTYQVQIVPNSPVDITLDTCIAKANLEFLKQNIPVAAYRLGREMAIAHNWPDDIFIAGTKHTLKILTGGGVDASVAAGFSYVANATIYGSAGNSFLVNGVQRSTFRIKMPLQGTAALGKSGFTILGNVIIFNSSDNNPLSAGVRIGDMINIQGLTSASVSSRLDGSRRIFDVTSNTITVDGDNYPIDVELNDSATLVVYSNVVSLDSISHRFQTDFANLDPNLSQNIIVQIFINSDGELDFHERLIYPNSATRTGEAYSGPSTLALTNLSTDNRGIYIVDCSRGLSGTPQGENRVISFQFDNKKRVFATFGCQSTDSSISSSLHGPPVNITGDGHYTLIDETGLEFVTIQTVKAFNILNDTVLNSIPKGAFLTYILPIVKFQHVNEFESLLLCNVYYNSQVNQIPILNGDLALSDKRYTGTIGAEQVRDDVIEKYVSGPMGETRGSGVVQGMYVPSDPTATQNITNDKVVYVNGGVAYVHGVRYEISSQQIFVDPATLDNSQYGLDGYFPGTGALPNGNGTYKNGYIKYYVFIDHFGKLQTTAKLNLPASLPFVPLSKVILTTRGILNNSPRIVAVNVVDFRLYISGIDDKIEIVVGTIEEQPAHFYSITAALEYVDNLRYNDALSGNNVHIRPTIIRLLDGSYQEPTTVDIPPFVTIKGESSRNVHIRPPKNLLTTSLDLIDSGDKNKYIFNVNLLPEGVSATIQNVCFDCNTFLTESTKNLPSLSNIGAIKVTWFSNEKATLSVSDQLVNAPSILDVKDCLFLLDGPFKTTGITTVFGTATPLITGGLIKFSLAQAQIFNKVDIPTIVAYNSVPNVAAIITVDTPVIPAANYEIPPTTSGDRAVTVVSTPQLYLPPLSITIPSPAPAPAPLNSPQVGPDSILGGKILQSNPAPPFTPEDAIFTDPNAPAGYNHGGIMNISNNTFLITDGYASVCIDRFYDTTVTSGYTSLNPVPISNSRMSAFKVMNNSFKYTSTKTSNLTNQLTLNTNGIIKTTTPVNTNSSTGLGAGQESLRDQMYDLMIHRELRGFAPYTYPNLFNYPDPKDGIGVPDGYNVPPAGGKLTEFMVISGNTPTGLNIPEAAPIRFATETQDSIARDQHGGGTVFATITIPKTGLPLILDKSIDWHDRYIYAYGTDVLTSPSATDSSSINNIIYTNGVPISQISTGMAMVPGISGDNITMVAQSPDKAMFNYRSGLVNGASHSFTYGYTSRLSGDLITINNPSTINMPGWSQIKYVGTMLFGDVTTAKNNAISIVVMPNGELAVLHAGTQDPAGSEILKNTKLVQTSDSYPANSATTTLSGNHASTGDIIVASTDGFYSSGMIVIETEQITYTSLGASPPRFLGCVRGANGSTAATHLSNVSVTGPESSAATTGSRITARSKTISFVIQYSPKLNVLTTSQLDSTVTINNLDNSGKAFGKIG